jgi:hypothetical protein
MKQYSLFSFTLFLLLYTTVVFAYTVSGKVTDEKEEPVPFASVYIKGTTRGTNSNLQGAYSMDLSPGKYEIVFKVLGYKQDIREIEIISSNLVINVKMAPESFLLKEAVISASAEDPAYAVIRQAQKKRKYYLEQVDGFSCDVYIKGEQRILKKPKKIMGMEIDPENEIDSITGMVYLSESVSRFNFKQKDKIREEMVSSKVSGDNKAFSYNQASDMLFNFYQNVMMVPSLSERGFISPISGTAMLSYKYKMIGTFYEDGKVINKIQVIPKRKHDAVFSGIINIMDDTWRIHSLELILTKDAQIDFVDTLRINQIYLPVDKDVWMPFSTKFTFNFGLLGIKGDGMFVGVNSNYVMNPDFPKHFFNNEILKVKDDANKKDSSYWKESRPIPLTIEEATDYRKRDSLALIRNSKPYRDSVDRKNNKFKLKDLLLGYSHSNTFEKKYFNVGGGVSALEFNTVQGLRVGETFNFSKGLENLKRYRIGINLGYGFSNKDFYGSATTSYLYNPQKFASLSIEGGREYAQFNGNNPIAPFINSLYSLLNTQNYLKLYLKNYVLVTHSSELINGLYFTPSLEYSEREPLVNTTDYTWIKTKNTYTSNDPRDTSNHGNSFSANQSISLTMKLRYVIKQRYFTAPHVKTVTGSKFPTLLLLYKKGISMPGSDVDYDLLSLGLEQNLHLKRLGVTSYLIKAGMFLNTNKMFFMDYYHFNGNQTLFSTFDMAGFQLLGYYTNSTNKQFLEGHLEHNFNGFIFSKIPLIQKLKLNEIIKASILTSDWKNAYAELSAGIQRLNFRADVVAGFSNQTQVSTGIRIGIKFN